MQGNLKTTHRLLPGEDAPVIIRNQPPKPWDLRPEDDDDPYWSLFENFSRFGHIQNKQRIQFEPDAMPTNWTILIGLITFAPMLCMILNRSKRKRKIW